MKQTVIACCCWIAAVLPSQAATVQVQVQNEAGRALQDAVVFLESREARSLTRPLQGAEMAQVNKQFVPRVLVVTTGTAVSFPNRDTVRHHVYSFAPTKTFEIKLYSGTAVSPVVFDRAGIAVLGCNIHDDMVAWVVVVDTPYWARSDPAGATTLVDVPAGSYRLRVWHPGLTVDAAATDQPLTVGTTDISIVYRLQGVSP